MNSREECLQEEEILSWLGGVASEEQRARYDVHLDGCDFCRSLMGELLRESGDDAPKSRTLETFRAGDWIAERYRIVRFVARGGMGEVYEAHDSWLKCYVALKTLAVALSDGTDALARLKEKVRAARQVSHPHVCRIFDLGFHAPTSRVGAQGKIAFITMEFLEGETLKARLKKRGPLASDEVREIALQMAMGLASAHASGVVHRDFKSENVMLVRTSGEVRAVVTDFGLARSSLRSTSSLLTSSQHGALGTLDYMSPEQVLGERATIRSDIYSLGVVLFEMTTGRLPFEGETALARAARRTRMAAPRPSSVGPVDPWCESLILRCLHAEPSRRFSRADDVVEFLRRGPQSVRWLSVRALALLIFAALVVIGGASWINTSRERTAVATTVSPSRIEPPQEANVPTATTVESSPPKLVEAPREVTSSPSRRKPGTISVMKKAVSESPTERGDSRSETVPDSQVLLNPFVTEESNRQK